MKYMENEYWIGERLYTLSLIDYRSKRELKQGKRLVIKLRVSELVISKTGIFKKEHTPH